MILLPLLLTASTCSPEPVRSDATRAAFREATAFAGSGAEVEAAARRLASMPEAAEALLEVWGPVGPGCVNEELLERTVARLDRRAAVSAVRSAFGDRPEPEWRATALVLLERHARRGELELVADLASTARPDDEVLLDAFQSTLTSLLRRDPAAGDWLYLAMRTSKPSRLRVLRAVGLAGDPDRIEWLSTWLDDDRLTSVSLQEIGRLARSTRNRYPEAAALVRAQLRHGDESVRRQALTAVRALGDAGAVPELVELSEWGTESEREGAFAALRDLTDRRIPDRPEAWREWYHSEVSWWEGEAQAALASLASPDDTVVVRALRELSTHWIHRDRIASEIGLLLERHSRSDMRAIACSTLQQLGSAAACDDLVVALRDPSEAVRGRAHAALRALTGRDAPPDPDAWRAELNMDR